MEEFDSLEGFVEVLAIPHLCSYIISEDYKCEFMNGYHLYWLSESYGAKEFPLSLPCPALDELMAGDLTVFGTDGDSRDIPRMPRLR